MISYFILHFSDVLHVLFHFNHSISKFLESNQCDANMILGTEISNHCNITTNACYCNGVCLYSKLTSTTAYIKE